jgi:hypothetical protein
MMMTIAERAAQEQITGTVTESGKPAPDSWPTGTVTWDVVLVHGVEGQVISTLMFSGPTAGEMTVVEALDSLISDASIVLDNNGLTAGGVEAGFAGYCADFGLNSDSRAAYATWEEMVEAAAELRDFFGGEQQLGLWVYETERP